MEISFSSKFEAELKKIKRNNLKLSNKILKQLQLFSINSKHPSLRDHKLSGHLSNSHSISADMSIRMLYKILADGSAHFFSIGTHDEIYRK
jgi:addiction module RelE/StbE family toxin